MKPLRRCATGADVPRRPTTPGIEATLALNPRIMVIEYLLDNPRFHNTLTIKQLSDHSNVQIFLILCATFRITCAGTRFAERSVRFGYSGVWCILLLHYGYFFRGNQWRFLIYALLFLGRMNVVGTLSGFDLGVL